MTILYLILGSSNLVLSGMLFSMINFKKSDGVKVKLSDYILTISSFLIGIYLLVCMIGVGAN